jgi:hypothetical protein
VIRPPPIAITGRFASRRTFAAASIAPGSGWTRPVEVVQVDVGGRGLDVHRHLEVDRAGPAGQHRVEGAMEDEGDLGDRVDRPLALGHRLDHAGEVVVAVALQLLHRPVALHVEGRRTGDRDQGGGVRVGGGKPHHRVDRPRSDRGEGDHRLAAGAVVAVGEVHGALLVEDL